MKWRVTGPPADGMREFIDACSWREFIEILRGDSLERLWGESEEELEDVSEGEPEGECVDEMAEGMIRLRLRKLCAEELSPENAFESWCSIEPRVYPKEFRQVGEYCFSQWGTIVRTEAFSHFLAHSCSLIDEDIRLIGGKSAILTGTVYYI